MNHRELKIGQSRQGRILAFRGDEKPGEMLPWLDEAYLTFCALEHDAELLEADLPCEGWEDFFSQIGIDVSSEHVEGAYGMGIFYKGWLSESDGKKAPQRAARLIERMERKIAAARKAKARAKAADFLSRLSAMDDAEKLMAADLSDGSESARLQEENAALAKAVSERREKLGRLEEQRREDDSRLDRLAEFLCSWREKRLTGARACGPFLAFGDALFLLQQVGPDRLLETRNSFWCRAANLLLAAGLACELVSESTITGGFLGRPFLRRISDYKGGWDEVWTTQPNSHARKLSCSSAALQSVLEQALRVMNSGDAPQADMDAVTKSR